MFTGIVMALGTVQSLTRKGEEAVICLDTDLSLEDVRIGDSIAVNGACLTMTNRDRRGFSADISAETLARTNLRLLKPGDRVNLEKALRLSDVLGGHLVLGHVDGMGTIREKTRRGGGSLVFAIAMDASLGRYVVEKGSIAVDGISLTVNRCAGETFYVNMVPHTARATTLGSRDVGDVVNLETDILAKYVEKCLDAREGGIGSRNGKGRGIGQAFLAEHGFLK